MTLGDGRSWRTRLMATGAILLATIVVPAAAGDVAVAETVWADQARDRDVPVRLYVPAAGTGPFPLVVFSHGWGESRRSYAHHGRFWASKGYLVVVANHAGTDTEGMEAARAGKMTSPPSFSQRPQDISFVIDRALAGDHELLAGRVDADRIAVAGHSLGSTTALAMVGLTTVSSSGDRNSFRDPRVDAAIAMSPQIGSAASEEVSESRARLDAGIDKQSWDAITAPVMVLMGTEDRGFGPLRSNPGLRRIVYDSMPSSDKYLVNLEGAEHHAFTDTPPFYPGGERDPRHYGWINQATIAFLDAYLKGDAGAHVGLQGEALEAETGGEVMQEHK